MIQSTTDTQQAETQQTTRITSQHYTTNLPESDRTFVCFNLLGVAGDAFMACNLHPPGAPCRLNQTPGGRDCDVRENIKILQIKEPGAKHTALTLTSHYRSDIV